jgi:hypothetical protein
MDEAIIAFGREDDAVFYASNPALRKKQVQGIKQSLGKYLLGLLNQQKRRRVLRDLEALQKAYEKHGETSIDYTLAKEQFLRTLLAKRAYKPSKSPQFMIFEAYADICLRSEQINALARLSESTAQTGVVFEARTGFGKSKALIPLWIYLSAQRRSKEKEAGLAMMTVPAALYQQQIDYLKEVLGGAFKQSVFAFRFERNKANQLSYLQYIHRELESAAKEGRAVLTTIASLHGMLNLKLKECLAKDEGRENMALLSELRKLRRMARGRLSNFFDESRECFDIRRHFDFAIGTPQCPPQSYCYEVGKLYETLMDLKLKVNLDFLPGKNRHQEIPMSDEVYQNQIKELLAHRLLERLMKDGRLPRSQKTDYAHLLQHFMGAEVPAIHSYLKKLPKGAQRCYASYREQINVFLARTLLRKCNSGYGLARRELGNSFAYPFERGVVQAKSQFCTVNDLVNFTLQANLKEPLDILDVKAFISDLKDKYSTCRDRQAFKKSNPDYALYKRLTGQLNDWNCSLSACQMSDIKRLHAILNKQRQLKLKLLFICGYILPKITVYTEKVSSTPHDIVASIERPFGTSGTINKDVHTPLLTAIEDRSAPVGSLLALWKNSQKAIFLINGADAQSVLANAVKEHMDYRVIIDVNGTFCDLKDDRLVADTIFAASAKHKTQPVKAVSYYDQDGKNRVFLRPAPGEKLGKPIPRSRCSLHPQDIFIFMRQSATVGSDTEMPTGAKALVTVGAETQRDLFVQGIGRMRGIQQGQEVGLLLGAHELPQAGSRKQRIELKSILDSISSKQGAQRAQDKFYNLSLLLKHFLEESFWNFVDAKEHSNKACMRLFQALKPFLLIQTAKDPLESLFTSLGPIPASKAVELQKNQFRQKLESIPGLSKLAKGFETEEILKKLEPLIDLKSYPDTIQMATAEEADGVVELISQSTNIKTTVVAALEMGQEDQEQESQQLAQSSLPSVHIRPGPPRPSESYLVMGRNKDLRLDKFYPAWSGYATVLKGIYGSENFLRLEAQDPQLLKQVKTAYHYLLFQEGRGFKLVLLDQKDSKAIIGEMTRRLNKKQNKAFYLLSSNGRVVAQDAPTELKQAEWERKPGLTLMCKVFCRDFRFSQREIDYLSKLSSAKYRAYKDFLLREIAKRWPPVLPQLRKLFEQVQRRAKRESLQRRALNVKVNP